MISGLLRAIAPGLEQRWDSSRRAKRLEAGAAINRILETQAASAIDIDELEPPITFAEETGHLKREVGRLADGLFGPEGGGRPNMLESRLRGFAKS
jgi:hypothetical protein